MKKTNFQYRSQMDSLKKRILLVEDRVDAIPFAKEAFERVFGSDYELTVVSDYKSAEREITENEYNGILTDCFFPYETGSDDVEEGRKIYVDMKMAEEEIAKLYKEDFDEDDVNEDDAEDEAALDRIVNLVREHIIKGYNVCLPSQSDMQPLGIRVYEEAHKRGIPVIMATGRHQYIEGSLYRLIKNYLSLSLKCGRRLKVETVEKGFETNDEDIDVYVMYKTTTAKSLIGTVSTRDSKEVAWHWDYVMKVLKRKVENKNNNISPLNSGE